MKAHQTRSTRVRLTEHSNILIAALDISVRQKDKQPLIDFLQEWETQTQHRKIGLLKPLGHTPVWEKQVTLKNYRPVDIEWGKYTRFFIGLEYDPGNQTDTRQRNDWEIRTKKYDIGFL